MDLQDLSLNTKVKQTNKTIISERLSQVIGAIADGRYTWACILLLRFAGFNPLYYIPQRTYYRLVKENQRNQSSVKTNKTITAEQLDPVVTAIADGKYSWACILLLQFADYNPRYYIPRRTYYRLMKENLGSQLSEMSEAIFPQKSLSRITDLGYLETADNRQHTQIQGGSLDTWLSRKILEYNSLEFTAIFN